MTQQLKKIYQSPTLIIYGDFQALTLSSSRPGPGYDAFQSVQSMNTFGMAGFTTQKTGRVCPPIKGKADTANCGY